MKPLHGDLINRRTEFRFAGAHIRLDLSLGLFSSAGVDAGSMLLLKTIAQQCHMDGFQNVLDAGCGAGVLGVALAARCPGAHINLIDRDRLAVDFSTHNANLNGLGNAVADQCLIGEDHHQSAYNLVATNFPAKAGLPVLEDFIHRAPLLLAPDGRIALVIIQPLADISREFIRASKNILVYEEATHGYSVFHFRPDTARKTLCMEEAQRSLLSPYIRHSQSFRVGRIGYKLETVWNIEDFDSVSWRIELLGKLLERSQTRGGAWVFWSPGQGHFPLLRLKQSGIVGLQKLILAGRDHLALLISERNLERTGNYQQPDIIRVSEPGDLKDSLLPSSVDFLLTDLNPIPRTDWDIRLCSAASMIVRSGGEWAMVGRSADMSNLLKKLKGWSIVEDKRHRGWRAVRAIHR